MKISSIQNHSYAKNLRQSFPQILNNVPNIKSDLLVSDVPTNAIKANFCPSFGRFRTVDRVLLQNKNSRYFERASIVKDKIGNVSLFKVMIGKKEAGYLDMDCSSIIPEDNFLVTECDNNIPEVCHIRSIMGDDYEGIGTSLMYAAVQESKRKGKNGTLWLVAEKGYNPGVSNYRRNQSPIPFYYKLGFICPDDEQHEYINYCLERGLYNNLPDSAVLILPKDRVQILEDYYKKNCEMD